MDKSVSEIFHHFIGRAVTLEDLQKLSSQMLVGFQQALEAFQRPPLHEASAVLAQVMASAPSERLDTYTDMGCRHVHSHHSVVIKLDSALKGLQNHIEQAGGIMEEMRSLLEQANAVMQEELNLELESVSLTGTDIIFEDSRPTASPSQQVLTSPRMKARGLHMSDYVTMMAGIVSMLEQDLRMQEQIVDALGLDLSSEVLQNYCMMWTLRPFVDETVVDKALTWIRP
ncbi:unnamed protein product [Sphagnum troendelagicum]|uniref:DUF7795 domain-containing protein n=1 Tax=Sphagnum troendelagicum TaxID=128251 RepID=A0ABP0TZP4_9BRYO